MIKCEEVTHKVMMKTTQILPPLLGDLFSTLGRRSRVTWPGCGPSRRDERASARPDGREEATSRQQRNADERREGLFGCPSEKENQEKPRG